MYVNTSAIKEAPFLIRISEGREAMLCKFIPEQAVAKFDIRSSLSMSRGLEPEGKSVKEPATEVLACPPSALTRNGGEEAPTEGSETAEGGAGGGVTAGLLVCTWVRAGEPRALAARANIAPSVGFGGIKV